MVVQHLFEVLYRAVDHAFGQRRSTSPYASCRPVLVRNACVSCTRRVPDPPAQETFAPAVSAAAHRRLRASSYDGAARTKASSSCSSRVYCRPGGRCWASCAGSAAGFRRPSTACYQRTLPRTRSASVRSQLLFRPFGHVLLFRSLRSSYAWFLRSRGRPMHVFRLPRPSVPSCSRKDGVVCDPHEHETSAPPRVEGNARHLPLHDQRAHLAAPRRGSSEEMR